MSKHWWGGALFAASAFVVVPSLVACGSGGGGASTSDQVTLQTTEVPPAVTGQEGYSFQFAADFPHPPGTYRVASGAVPTGMKLDPLTGRLTGVPRLVGTSRFAIAAQDGVDLAFPPGRDVVFAEDQRQFEMVVTRGPPNLLEQTLPSAAYRRPYAYQLVAAGGVTPYRFTDVSTPPDGLPDGITVSDTGLVGLFPTSIGDDGHFHFVVQVTDAEGNSDVQGLDLTVLVRPLVIDTPPNLPPAAAEFPYSVRLELASDGGGPPIRWSQEPLVPGETLLADIGMELDDDGTLRNLSGTPGPRRDAEGPFVPPYTVTFTARVQDEPLQVATRTYSLTVNPGPVLTSITPSRASAGGPFVVAGLNFQPGATLTFKPGPNEVVITPDFVNASTLRFSPAPASSTSGAVAVMVTNPDGGHHTRNAAFVYPATNLSFGTKGFVGSALSSTGLACADLNADGLADIVHCGAAGVQACPNAASSTSPGLELLMNAGGSPLAFVSTVLDGASYYDVKLADVNQDGRPDVVALGASSLSVWLNGAGGNPPGTLSSRIVSSLPGGFAWPSEMAIGRIDGNAVPDVAFGVANFPFPQNPNGRVYTMAGAGDGSFTPLDAAVNTMPATWGVTSLACVDSDGNGRTEIAAGQGLNQTGTGPILNHADTNSSGIFQSWNSRGGPVSTPLYASTTGVIAGDFLGTGGQSVVAIMTGSPGYAPGHFRYLAIFSGSGLTTQTTLTPQTAITKSGTPIDGDFDAKLDFAVSAHPSSILVYRGSTLALNVTLDASSGVPSVSNPRTGRLASGDLDGDGRPDLLATTSYWAVSSMATYYSTIYDTMTNGNGGSMGIVYYLNSSN